jgi:hypothetical protein
MFGSLKSYFSDFRRQLYSEVDMPASMIEIHNLFFLRAEECTANV